MTSKRYDHSVKMQAPEERIGEHTLEMEKDAVTYRLPEAILKEIRAESKRTGLRRNNVVEFALSKYFSNLKKSPFTPYAMIGTAQVVMYDRKADTLVFVTLEEDEDEVIHLVCEEDMTDKCDHAEFVSKIPKVKEWVRESKEEAKP